MNGNVNSDIEINISEILDDISSEKDVTIKMINLNKQFGISKIIDWLEVNYNDNNNHKIFGKILYDYTMGFKSGEQKGRLVNLREKWKRH